MLRLLEIEFVGVDIYPHRSSILKIDVRDANSLKVIDAIGADTVVHLAAQVDVASSLNDPLGDLESNIVGTVNVLQAAIRNGVQNIVYISSGGAIYEEGGNRPTSEYGALNLKSPYGVSKLAGEFYVRVLSERNGIAWSSLALSNCYGPVSECKKGVIFEFYTKLKNLEAPIINGCSSSRDFIHVSDVVQAIIKAIERPSYMRVNVSTARETSLIHLYELISKQMNAQVKPIIKNLDSGEVTRSCLDNTLAESLLGWKPKITIEQGIPLVLQ
jgi:UDP-glucose 4-epimerase